MCSIFGILHANKYQGSIRKDALQQSHLLLHRGSDHTGIYEADNAILIHNRISIIDVVTGNQPFMTEDGSASLIANGEIYNHKELRESECEGYPFSSASDCEVILALYEKKKMDFLEYLNGMFAFIIHDEANDDFLVARDHLGIMSLYYGYDQFGCLYVASEKKALLSVCTWFKEFPAGHYLCAGMDKPKRYYKRSWEDFRNVENNVSDVKKLKKSLEDAVERQLMSDVPFGMLLSGGLDSSIITAIICKLAKDPSKNIKNLNSFAVGLEGSPDLPRAREVADILGTNHFEYVYTQQEGLDALVNTISHIETYDVTTVRASIPMYLLARYIRSKGIKMVLSGEGSDELFGGYLYFHKAPGPKEFHEETVRKLFDLHKFDCLRANKSMLAWGVEPRVPFLDKEFIDVAMSMKPEDKMCGSGKMEKHILRKCFSEYLPESIVWRQKEQFSDGVGYAWIDALKILAETEVTDSMLESAHFRFPENTPMTKEAYMYRDIYSQRFPHVSAASCVPGGPTVACSTAKALEWETLSGSIQDPSGRAVIGIHQGT